MCGIAGRFAPAGSRPDEGLIRRMCGVLSHRGPDEEGFYHDRWLSAGMRRLSIIDVAGGHQPLFNEDGSIVLLFNGEIYNFVELRRELMARGHVFRTHSDGEVLVHLYEERQIACLDQLNGMFAFCIWDSRAREGYLVRDRIGIKPVYYTISNGALLFASELKALTEAGVSVELDEQALLEYLHYLCIPAPRTPFKQIQKLPPASFIRISSDAVSAPTTYWEYPTDESPVRSDRELGDEFFALVESAVELQLRSDVPVGVFLSGGIDSSLITGLAARKAGQTVLSFSVAYPGNPFDEAPFARLAAGHFKSDLRSVTVGPAEVAEMLPRAVWHMDEPHADSAAVATLAVSDLAASHVKVVLSGTGGDELFAGYLWHVPPRPALRALQALPGPVVGTLAGALKTLGVSEETTRAMRWVRDSDTTFAWPHYQFKPGELDGFFGRGPEDDGATCVFMDRLASVRTAGLNRLLEMDARFYLTNDLLLLLDKMTMASSIEGRVPLLDHRLVEWAFRIPGHLKMDGRSRKALLKRWLRGFLPDELLARPKWGFGAPIHYWMRGELDALGRSLLRTRPPSRAHFAWGLTGDALDRRLQALSAQKRYALLVLELWCRLYLDRADRALSLGELAA
jgi:asparagine synthase (glutamine-hydrolysing)